MRRALLVSLTVFLLGWSFPAAAFAPAHVPYPHYDAFPSRSHLVLGGGITPDTHVGSQSDPLSLHKYLYAHNNPINRIDPSGHESLISLSIASSMGMALRLGYDTSATAAGAAIQKTIMGVQAGKSAEAILTEYVVETVVAAVAAYTLIKVMGRAFDLDGVGSAPLTSAEQARFVPFRPKIGTPVYRVIPRRYATLSREQQMEMIYRSSWTTVDPRKVRNFADAAGLPSHNDMGFIVEGRIVNPNGIKAGPAVNNRTFEADSPAANAGGLFELRMDDAMQSVQVERVISFQ
jgi:hypothetical protein